MTARGLIVLLLGALGCTTTLKATTTQPNPLVAFPNQAMHRSQKLYIDMKDMDLPRMPAAPYAPDGAKNLSQFRLRQSAYFAVVSRERLRFHVTIVHKWKEVADPTSWNVQLEDDSGRIYYPESKEANSDNHITQMWDNEQRTALYGQFGDAIHGGDVAGLKNDGYLRRMPLQSIDVFKGSGDFSFHAKDIFHRKTKRLTLRMERYGVVYEFTWNLIDLGGDEPGIAASNASY